MYPYNYNAMHIMQGETRIGEKLSDLTQSYDRIPHINRKFTKQSDNTKTHLKSSII